jgi:NAD(P)-dependent dehydrogenase (short-subunit alcohol dehydrogenase family)
MKKQGYGRFVFISSTAGMLGQHLDAHYAATKAGLVGLTNIIALEGAPHGILANTVLPTGFSRMVTEAVGDTKALEESGFLNMIRPELVTPMVVYLASRGARAAIAITRRSVHRPVRAQGRPVGHRGAHLSGRMAERRHVTAVSGARAVPRLRTNGVARYK